MKGRIFKIVLCLAFASFLAAFSGAQAENVTIVSINTGQVLQSHPAFHEAVAKFQEKHQEIQQKIIQADEAEQAMVQMQAQQELQALGMKLQEDATEKMRKDVSKVAEEKGYDYVVDQEGLIVVSGRQVTDVTVEMIESFTR